MHSQTYLLGSPAIENSIEHALEEIFHNCEAVSKKGFKTSLAGDKPLSPMLEALLLAALKRKMLMPISADDMTIDHLRPIAGTLYMAPPKRTPTMPGR